ncbi:hypothetical protein FCL47_23155 [Desulfopila sp. IMCC35006]|uniref:hypothetical protein n=1 Tax=Desulfopila sp. IMCC35006 TaxID=2569542 RepID=UPI0010AD5A05|nr:hypothetical protein [Desulfopila sp. IMCC35006]TKB23260.1 hypothetical protein FCL47_23155 [Desulfopila sp. IMCC35006]
MNTSVRKYLVLLLTMLLLQSCAVYVAYGLYRTVTDINATLTLVDKSITNIQGVLSEGKNLKRAAADGKLISTLAEKIPSLIQKDVALATKEKIVKLSGDLKFSSDDFTNKATAEDLPGAKKAYNDMTTTYGSFTDLMNDLSDSVGEPLR